MMKLTLVCVALLLTGCSTAGKLLENRVVCTVDGSESHVVSKWGPVGIAARVADADAKVLCKRRE